MWHQTIAKFLAFLGLLFATPSPASTRDDIQNNYQLRFIDTSPETAWTARELADVDSLLRSIPAPVAKIAKTLPRVHVTKTYRGKKSIHTGPNFLHWQIEINLSGFKPGENNAKTVDLIYRQLVHGLFHLFDAEYEISRSPSWRSISGWQSYQLLGVELPMFLEKSRNHNPEAFASASGMQSAAEDFATFGENFFLAKQTSAAESIKCRNPTKYRFLQRLFPRHDPPLERAGYKCIDPGHGFLDDIIFFDPISEQKIDMGPISEETVTGFELLYATPGVNDAAEIAGHLVLRVKLNNNPGIGEEQNPNDLVISFLADTAEGEPMRADSPPAAECKDGMIAGMFGGLPANTKHENPWDGITQALRGLSGGFLTTFDRQTLDQTVRSYTGLQDRNLLRFELVLSEEQKRSLIQRLYLAKLNYKTKYYFFDRNCASILVQVIGEGIADGRVADFDPYVIPPNSLIALMRRHGLARPVYPAFYSYKRRAQIAQETIVQLVGDIGEIDERANAIATTDFFSTNSTVRNKAYQRLFALQKNNSLHPNLYRIAQLAQEAEQEFLDREKKCENYTSDATATARKAQQALLHADPGLHQRFAIDTNTLLDQSYAGREEHLATTGSPHTKLMSFGIGAGAYRYNGEQAASVNIRGSLFRQDMGDRAYQSMQRATAVRLVDIDVTVESQTGEIRETRLTGLRVRKFKERLDEVPTYMSNPGKIGLGLSVVDFVTDDFQSYMQWAGGELLANIASSHAYDKHIFAYVGTTAESRWGIGSGGDNRQDSIGLSMGISGLYTIGQDRRWQLRGSMERRYSVLPGSPFQDTAKAQLSTMFGRPFSGEGIAGFRMVDLRRTQPHFDLKNRTQRMEVFVEWNRW